MPRRNPPTGDPILDLLKVEREVRGWSQQQLAEEIGRSSYQTIFQWESGSASPTLRCLRDWTRALGFEITLTPVPEEADRG